MAATAVIMNIREMIDQAIGTPEVGVVDFNMLHTLLHCMVQQMHVEYKNVELRGSVAGPPLTRDHGSTIRVQEFLVDTGPEPGSKKYKEIPEGVTPKEDTILVAERVKEDDAGGAHTRPSGGGGGRGGLADAYAQSKSGGGGKGKPEGAEGKGGGSGGAEVAVTPSRERLSIVTLNKFNVLKETVDDLKQKVYGTLPKNEDMIEGVRSQTNITAITDMWNTLNVQSRLDAAENGISKLSSLVQDLINENEQLQSKISKTLASGVLSSVEQGQAGQTIAAGAPEAPGSAEVVGAAGGLGAGGGMAGSQGAAGASGPASSLAKLAAQASQAGPDGGFADMSKGDIDAIVKNVADLRMDVDNLYATFLLTMDNVGIMPSETGMPTSDPLAVAMAAASSHMDEAWKEAASGGGSAADAVGRAARGAGGIARASGTGGAAGGPGGVGGAGAPGMAGMGGAADQFGGAGGYGVTSGGAIPVAPVVQSLDPSVLEKRILELEKKIDECCDDLSRNGGRMGDKLNHLEEQVDYVLKQLGIQTGDILANQLSPEVVKDLQGLMQLFETVQGMQSQLQEVHNTAMQLAAEKENRAHHINTLLEQVELLKVIKMDKEDMAEAMADKADLRLLARKVSRDQFEQACDDLAKGMEHAIGKLNMQESLWQQALDDIQREIETKLDKMELSPVKEFFNNKLKQLQDNLKQLAALRREVEAAGTKRRLLRDVNCISCDANAVMAMDTVPSMPANKPLPPSHSMKPYLSYELDAIRRAQACNVQQRNMHDWETIDKQMGGHSRPEQRVRSASEKHLCNRYCGGSHTVTTPAQRVARVGHFVKQWGPDVLPLTSGLAAGDDGKMYKVTNVEGAAVGPGGAVDTTCTSKSPPRKASDAKMPQKPIVISAECRCLEAMDQKQQ